MISIFGKKQCNFCNEAKKICIRYGFEYEYCNIEYKNFLDDLKAKLPDDEYNYTHCPYIFWNGKYIGTLKDFLEEIENTIGGFGEQKI